MYCPNCGKMIDEGSRFCGSCGKMIEINCAEANPRHIEPKQHEADVPGSATRASKPPYWLKFWGKIFDYKGSSSPREFFAAILINAGLGTLFIVLMLAHDTFYTSLGSMLYGSIFEFILAILAVILLVIGILPRSSLYVRRAHDCGAGKAFVGILIALDAIGNLCLFAPWIPAYLHGGDSGRPVFVVFMMGLAPWLASWVMRIVLGARKRSARVEKREL